MFIHKALDLTNTPSISSQLNNITLVGVYAYFRLPQITYTI